MGREMYVPPQVRLTEGPYVCMHDDTMLPGDEEHFFDWLEAGVYRTQYDLSHKEVRENLEKITADAIRFYANNQPSDPITHEDLDGSTLLNDVISFGSLNRDNERPLP